MPLYEYECQQCHRRLEKILRYSDPEETVCPHCGGTLERVISAPAIQFKGAGWYVNDYAKSGAKPPAAANPSEAKSPEGSKDSSQDSGSRDSGSSPAATSSPASETSTSTSAPASSAAQASSSTSKSD